MAQQRTAVPFHSLLSHKGIPLGLKQIVHREDAQSLVELTLVVPLFLLLLIGSAELARVAWAAILTANAARAGAAYGSQSVNTETQGAVIQAYAANDGVNLANLVTTPSTFCACSDGTSIPTGKCGSALSYCAAPATIFNYVQVNTSSTVTPLLHLPGLPRTFTVTGPAIMVIEQ
jgi:Flp pilus assembly protein TadG